MKRNLSLILVLVMLLSLLVGCGNNSKNEGTKKEDTTTTEKTENKKEETQKEETPAEPAKGGTLRASLSGDAGNFDPVAGTTAVPQQIIKACYRGLFSVAPDGSLKPELCTDYTVSEDGLTYTFNLRNDAKWSDGKTITAHDFVWGWQRNLSPALGAAYSSLLCAVVNYDECMAGEKEPKEFGVKALDDFTLEVTLEYTQPYFVQQTTFSPFYPVREDIASWDSSNWSIDDVKAAVYSGPMMVDTYSPNDKVVLVPNPESYQADEVVLDAIEFYFISDAQSAAAAFNNGELDMVFYPDTNIGATHSNPAEYTPITYLVNNIYVFSGRCEALSDVRVRKAINMAINREQICALTGSITKPLYGLVPPGITNPATGKDFREEGGNIIVEDIAKAQELMAEAGYPNGEGFPEITLLSGNNQMRTDTAVAIQAMLKDNLGINLKLNLLESQAFSAERRAGNFDICFLGTSADYNDPTTWLSLYIGATSYIERVAGYQSPNFDELMFASDLEQDPGKRFELLHQAEESILDEYAWWFPVMSQDQPMLTKEYVKNWSSTTSGDVYVHAAWIEQ